MKHELRDWEVLTDLIQLYGQRFGGTRIHFEDQGLKTQHLREGLKSNITALLPDTDFAIGLKENRLRGGLRDHHPRVHGRNPHFEVLIQILGGGRFHLPFGQGAPDEKPITPRRQSLLKYPSNRGRRQKGPIILG
jgi:hypothetical protein